MFRRSPAELLVIVNSDIHLVESQRLAALIGQADCNLLLGNRLDVPSLDSVAGEVYRTGYDYACIDRHAAGLLPPSMFAMDAPWWDLWVPMLAVLHGAQARRCAQPVARRVCHPQNWSMTWHAWYALHLVEFVCDFATAGLESGRISLPQRAVVADILVAYIRARRHRALQLGSTGPSCRARYVEGQVHASVGASRCRPARAPASRSRRKGVN